jgi:inhibitor of KinA sporulation pathway (predicted exonuclease)
MRYVVIDFEATCDEPYNPEPQEVIEFPAVVVDSDTATPGPEFHLYLKPVVHSRLTKFCMNLTGIRQDQVDEGVAFPQALSQFEHWRQTQSLTESLLVTCGDWDLGSLLPRQCAQHGVPIPEWADRWCNLKRLFAWHFPQAGDRTRMGEIASALSITMEGRAHSGIDDARNIARILRRLLDMGILGVNTAFWRCVHCGGENLRRDWECSGCGRSGVTLLPGDWACPQCGCGNFAHRDKCFDCGTRRTGARVTTPHGPSLKPGDWVCGACSEHNFARRSSCFKCGERRR